MPGGGFSPEFDFDETKPAGSTKGYDADNWLRSNLQHLCNILSKEHYEPSSDPDDSEDDTGSHYYITLKEIASKPSSLDSRTFVTRHGFYAKSDGIYIEETDGTEHCILNFSTGRGVDVDIPSGEIILFDKDTAVTGYTLKTDVDDQLVFITKGFAAGGETGGGAHSSGTWTQPDHTLTVGEIPAHGHNIPYYIGQGEYANEWAVGGAKAPYNIAKDLDTDNAGGGGAHNHGTTWRPASRCFTRQERD